MKYSKLTNDDLSMEYNIINIVYDLIAQNSIKGAYNLDHERLTDMLKDVDSENSLITLVDDVSKITYQLKLITTHKGV